MNAKDGKIVVVGMGYVGIPAAALLADAGYDVTGLQRRSERSGWKIDWLNEGRCPIGGPEPELPEILKRVVDAGRFRATDDYECVRDARIILIDVQTAVDADHNPDYRPLDDACRSVGQRLSPGQTVIIESTVGPGTTEHLVKPALEQASGLTAGLPAGFGLSFSYERVMVGRLIHNIREYPKIVGGIDAGSIQTAMDMYRNIVNGGVYGTDLITAEVSKTVENAYRDVQIAFANEVALLCEALGADVYEVREFVNGLPNDPSRPRANPLRNMLYPGAGVGGHCLPKDTWLLMHGYQHYANAKLEYPMSVLQGARRLNDWMPLHMMDLLEGGLAQANQHLKGSRICVLGYAFLENSDDARNTPSAPLLDELDKSGAISKVHDPLVERDGDRVIEHDLEAALTGADAVVLMTAHEGYKAIDPDMLKRLMRGRVVIDGRNVLDPAAFTAEGFVFRGVGKGKLSGHPAPGAEK